jgi:hypothetical protein
MIVLPKTPELDFGPFSFKWRIEDRKTYCTLFVHGTEVASVYSRCHPDDVFENVYGMRQSLKKFFKTYFIPKHIRDKVRRVFYKAYGKGINITKEQLRQP